MAFVERTDVNTPTPMSGNPWWYSSGNVFYAAGYGLPNCTCYAYGRFAEIAGQFITGLSGGYGDAKTWYPNTTGLQKGSVPALGAVACWGSRSGNYGGHVAIVEHIYSNGDILTSNSAYNSTYFYTQYLYKSNGYAVSYHGGDYYFQGFIYNPFGGVAASDYVIAAICGNFAIESNINPGLWESMIQCAWDYQYEYTNKGGYGLGQWTNVGTPYGRCWNLHTWVTSNGYTDGDGDGQLAFLLHEDYWANVWGSYSTLTDFLQSSSTDTDMLTECWMRNWEGIVNNTLPQRKAYAAQFLQYIQAHKNDDPGSYTWISVNRYLSNSEMQNNVMCVYFWFLMHGGGTGGRQMKWWLYWKLSDIVRRRWLP